MRPTLPSHTYVSHPSSNSRVSQHLELCHRDLPLKATRHPTREPRPNVEWTVEEIVDAASVGVLPVTGH